MKSSKREKITVGRIWGIIYPMLIYLAITYVIMIVLMIGFAIKGMMSGITGDVELTNYLYDKVNGQVLLLTMIAGIMTIPVMLFLYRRDTQKDISRNTFEKYERVRWLKYLLIIPFGIFNMMWANMFVALLQMFMPEFMIKSYSGTAEAIYGSSLIIQFITAGFVGPIVEEMIFRALVYKRTKKIAGMIPAAIISSVLFGVFHANWIQAPYAIIIGFMCVFVYEKYKSIIAPIILHISANCFSLLIAFWAGDASSTEAEQSLETIKQSEYIFSLLITILVMGLLAFITGAVIYAIVRPKKINNINIENENIEQNINNKIEQNTDILQEEEKVDMENTFYYQRRDK